MSIGHAGESHKSIENTKKWLLEVEPEEFDCTIITTYPGSPYFDDAIKKENYYVYVDPRNGDKLYQAPIDYLSELDYYKGDPDDGYVSYVWTQNISGKEIVEARGKLETEEFLLILGVRAMYMSIPWEWAILKYQTIF
jgi:anaerobic magnesium-protoporphyrin IX monomethyl ester cyclase